MARFLEKLLNLQRGDLGRGALLFTYLFLIMFTYIIARVSRDSLFLDQYKAVSLPYADLAIAALVGFVVSGYLFLGRNTSLRNLLVGCLVFFSLNSFLFWWLAHFHRFPLLYPIIYVWVGIFGVLAPAQVWTLANYVLTTREAKRVFGLVGSGSILGAILGGKFANATAPRFGTESLLLGMAVTIAICCGLVILIWRKKEATFAPGQDAEERPEENPPALRDSLRLVWSSGYLRSIARLILVASIVTSVAGWQFKALAKMFIPGKNDLTAFFGDFYFYAGIAGLLVQLLVTSRLLRRFGLGPALFVVPMALLFGSSGVVIWGAVTIWAAIALRSGINVLQYSIDKSTVELLYLPVAANIKNQVKSFIDTVIWRFGDGFAAVAVLLFTTTLRWSPDHAGINMSWVNMVFILAWLIAAVVARRQYVGALRESIFQHRLDAERVSAPVLDRSTTDILADNLRATDPQEILYALDLFGMGRQRAVHPAIRGLLVHPAAAVRQRALNILAEAGDETIRPQVEKLLQDPALEVRTEALLYLTHHAHIDPVARIQELGDFPDFSIRSAMVAFLARPGASQNLEAARVMLDLMTKEPGEEGQRTRLEAARLMGTLPDEFDEQLRHLLQDPDPEVACAAIRAVGKLKKRRFALRLLDRIADPHCTADVNEALGAMGDGVVGTLRDHLNDPAVPLEIRREIPAVLTHIGTPSVARVLEEHLLEADTQFRFRVISSLNKLRQSHPEVELDKQMVETVLAAEMMGHYRSYQILGTLGHDLAVEDPVVRALRETLDQEVERIFRLLGLLYPHLDLHSAYFGLQSKDPIVHDNALEFLDNVLKPQLRNMLVPLLDSGISVTERVRLASRMVGGGAQTPEEAVAALVASEDPWLKSCGAYAIGTLGLKSLAHELENCLRHADPLLRETARQAKLRLAALSAPASSD